MRGPFGYGAASHTPRDGTRMIALLLSLLLMADPCETAAFCRCVPIAPEDAMERAEAVFTATVVSVRSLPAPPDAPAVGQEARMRVHAAWKGVDTSEVIVVSRMTSCDFTYRPGDRYLIYGRVDADGTLRATYCGGSRTIQPDAGDAETLGTPRRSWPEPRAD